MQACAKPDGRLHCLRSREPPLLTVITSSAKHLKPASPDLLNRDAVHGMTPLVTWSSSSNRSIFRTLNVETPTLHTTAFTAAPFTGRKPGSF
jgi:hypothetical protein